MLVPNQYFDIKIIKTNIEHYRSLGYDVQLRDVITVPAEHLTKGSQLRSKIFETMYKNGTVPTSTQQTDVYNIIKKRYSNVELNYPFNKFSLDIFLLYNNIKIDIEYDGWYWHQDSQRDRRRDEYLKSQGFKIFRIRSGKKLPTEEQLFETIDKLINTDRKYTEIKLDDWKEGEVTA